MVMPSDELVQAAQQARTNRNTKAEKQKAQEIAATGVRPTNAQLLGGRGKLKKTSSSP